MTDHIHSFARQWNRYQCTAPDCHTFRTLGLIEYEDPDGRSVDPFALDDAVEVKLDGEEATDEQVPDDDPITTVPSRTKKAKAVEVKLDE